LKNPARNVTPLTLERPGILPPKSDTHRRETAIQKFAKRFSNQDVFFLAKITVEGQMFCLWQVSWTCIQEILNFADV
jgi:hypothetical protein